ncbi:MAG: hypothetical protein Q7T55_01240 [Solirubrobacteraceae bacterium]|nr:hypothetical protein [Solirubrobacteraceae bacterium]
MAGGANDKRDVRSGFSLKSLVVALAFGAILGFVAAATGVPVWLVVPAAMVVAFGVTFAVRMRSMMAVPETVVLCARCETQPRGASGFCDGCREAVHVSPLPEAHPGHRFILALEREDLNAAAPFVAPKIRFRMGDRRVAKLSREAWLRSARISIWAYREREGTILGLHLDPANADHVWALTYNRARGRFVIFPSVDATTLTRYAIPHEQVVAIDIAPALPPR